MKEIGQIHKNLSDQYTIITQNICFLMITFIFQRYQLIDSHYFQLILRSMKIIIKRDQLIILLKWVIVHLKNISFHEIFLSI